MSEDLQWRARTFADKVLKSEVQKEIIKLALVVLGNHKLTIEHNKDGFDAYTYCKHETKKFCPVGNKTMCYRGKWREYVVHGHTRTDIYLEVLKLLANDNSVYYPIVSARTDDEWIPKEKFGEVKSDSIRYRKGLKEIDSIIKRVTDSEDNEEKKKLLEYARKCIDETMD